MNRFLTHYACGWQRCRSLSPLMTLVKPYSSSCSVFRRYHISHPKSTNLLTSLLLCCGGLTCGLAFICSDRRWEIFSHARCIDPSSESLSSSLDSQQSVGDANSLTASGMSLQPSFGTILLYKLYHLEISEVWRPEVFIELMLLSVPLLLGRFLSYRIYARSKLEWKRRSFFHVCNVSLNTVQKNPETGRYSLSFRTLMERPLNELILNPAGVEKLVKAAKVTNEQKCPLIQLPSFEEQWTISNQIANQISALSAPSFIHRDIAADSSHCLSQSYIMALTCEPEMSAKTRKIRVILIRRDSLEQMIEDMGVQYWEMARLENERHSFRWLLLRQVAVAYENQEKNKHGTLRWGRPLCELELVSITPSMKGMMEEEKDLDSINSSHRSSSIEGGSYGQYDRYSKSDNWCGKTSKIKNDEDWDEMEKDQVIAKEISMEDDRGQVKL